MSVVEDSHQTDNLDDSAVLRAVEEYLTAMKSGRCPDRTAFLARHPAVAGPLADCLDALVFVQKPVSAGLLLVAVVVLALVLLPAIRRKRETIFASDD